MRSGVGRDRRQVGVEAAPAVELALEASEATVERVDVGVAEAGRQRSAAQVDHAGPGPDQCPDGRVTADRHDPAITRRDGAGPAPRRVHGGDPTTGQDEVGRTVAAHRCPLVVTTGTTPGTMAGRARMQPADPAPRNAAEGPRPAA